MSRSAWGAGVTLRNPFARTKQTDLFSWFHSHLLPTAAHLADTYRNAKPFPHIVVDDFLPDDIAELCLARFPKPEDAHFEQPDVGTHQVRKLGRTQESYFRGVDPQIRRVLSEFNEMPFLDFLEALTGIAGLIPDPHFRGGAFHQILTGGKLDMHADFNVDRRRRLLRRINVLIYLNKPWPAATAASFACAAMAPTLPACAYCRSSIAASSSTPTRPRSTATPNRCPCRRA